MIAVAKKATILPEPLVRLPTYDVACRRCERLATLLDAVRADYPSYFCRPVAAFGASDAPFVIVGLAPGMHGANATGRPFTGDYAGILLYATLHAYGFASKPIATGRDDGLVLRGCRITNAVKCLPPDNKPAPVEIANCNDYLAADLAQLPGGAAVLALGRIAHDAALRALGLRPARFEFAHGARHDLARGVALFASYHCSRYNTNTGRLTTAMFHAVFDAVEAHLARTTGREPRRV
jgi:uracil-DNA glycosylase family 4